MSERTFTHLVIAWVLMQDRGKDRSGHVGSNAVIRKGSAVAFAVGAPSLAPGLRGIVRLVDGRENPVKWKSEIIKDACGCQPIFLPGGQRGKFLGGFDGAVIGHDLEDAVVDGASFLFELALADLGVVVRISVLSLRGLCRLRSLRRLRALRRLAGLFRRRRVGFVLGKTGRGPAGEREEQ